MADLTEALGGLWDQAVAKGTDLASSAISRITPATQVSVPNIFGGQQPAANAPSKTQAETQPAPSPAVPTWLWVVLGLLALLLILRFLKR